MRGRSHHRFSEGMGGSLPDTCSKPSTDERPVPSHGTMSEDHCLRTVSAVEEPDQEFFSFSFLPSLASVPHPFSYLVEAGGANVNKRHLCDKLVSNPTEKLWKDKKRE